MVTSLLALRNRIRLVYGCRSSKVIVQGETCLFAPLFITDIKAEDITMYKVESYNDSGVLFHLDPDLISDDFVRVKPLPTTPSQFTLACSRMGIKIEECVKKIDEKPGTLVQGIPIPNTHITYTVYTISLPQALVQHSSVLLAYLSYIPSSKDERKFKVLFVDQRARRKKQDAELSRLIRELVVLYEGFKGDVLAVVDESTKEKIMEVARADEEQFEKRNGWVEKWVDMVEEAVGRERGFFG